MKRVLIFFLLFPVLVLSQSLFTESEIKNWLDKNYSDPIEGIWVFSNSNSGNYFKGAILKIDGEFVEIIIECYGDMKRVCDRQGGRGTRIAKVKKMAAEGVYVFNQQGMSASAVMSGPATMEVFYPGNGQKAFAIKEYPSLQQDKPQNTFSSDSNWSGNGSGIIISKSGHIITNHHVIENSKDIEVEFILNEEVQKFNAEIVQVDKVNDLAIIKIVDMNFDGVDDLPYNFKIRSSDVGALRFMLMDIQWPFHLWVKKLKLLTVLLVLNLDLTEILQPTRLLLQFRGVIVEDLCLMRKET